MALITKQVWFEDLKTQTTVKICRLVVYRKTIKREPKINHQQVKKEVKSAMAEIFGD